MTGPAGAAVALEGGDAAGAEAGGVVEAEGGVEAEGVEAGARETLGSADASVAARRFAGGAGGAHARSSGSSSGDAARTRFTPRA